MIETDFTSGPIRDTGERLGTGQVPAGAPETSGADAASSMVEMIASLRAFQGLLIRAEGDRVRCP